MNRTITGDFKSVDAMTNAMDDLLASGFDREKVYMDEEHLQLKVIIPAEVEREVNEILQRHRPTKLH